MPPSFTGGSGTHPFGDLRRPGLAQERRNLWLEPLFGDMIPGHYSKKRGHYQGLAFSGRSGLLLINEPQGRMLLCIAGGMQLMGMALIKKIVNIKV